MASAGSQRLLDAWSAAVRDRRPDDLLQLFSRECLQQCRGFRFEKAQTGGGFHAYRWATRAAPGSLADDLYGQLMLFERVDRARVAFVRLNLENSRQAEAVVALAVDGRMRDGARRSDRGTLRLSLRRQADDTWRIEGFALGPVRSVMSRAPLFAPAQVLRPADAGATGAADLGAPDADRGLGLAIADVDGDGWLDVFLPGPGLGQLLRNDGRGGLRPDPPLPGIPAADTGHQARFGDLDGDGDPDLLVVASRGTSRWLENRRGRFVPRAGPAPTPLGPGAAAAVLDSHGDGRLAFVFAPMATAEGPRTGGAPAAPPRPQLYRVTPQGHQVVPNALPASLTDTAAICPADLDGDGRTDLVHVSRLGPVTLLRNRGGRFEALPGLATGAVLGRGCTVADLDGDGDLDVAIAAVRSHEGWKAARPDFPLPSPFQRGVAALRARLQAAVQGSFWLRNDGRGQFVRRSLASPASLGWDLAVAAEDVDGDGTAELVLGGGFHWRRRSRPQDDAFFTSVLARRLGGRRPLRLDPARGSLGATRGATLLLGRGTERVDVGVPAGLDLRPGVVAAAWADLDRDGRPELLLRHRDGSLTRHALKAPLGPGRVVTLRLGARGPAGPSGVTVTATGLERRARAVTGSGVDRPWGEVRLGLGSAARADRVQVRWSDGVRSTWQDLDTRAAYTLTRHRPDPTPGLGSRLAGRPPGPGAAPPGRKAAPGPAAGPPPGDTKPLTVAGLPVGRLPALSVVATQDAAARPRPLRSLLGRGGTVLYLPPGSCPGCKTYLPRLDKAGRAWAKRGVAVLVIDGTPRAFPQGLVSLRLGKANPAPARLLGLLLVLDGTGRPRTVFIGSQPDPALLEHHLPPVP